MKGRSASTLAIAAVLALGVAACGDDDENTTVTETVPTVLEEQETTVEPTVTDDVTTTTPTQVGPGAGGETADLPLCTQGPPPCRTADGTVEVP